MTSRRKLEEHQRSVAEIRNIINSMKTLAYMETLKLDPLLGRQHTVVRSMDTVAADFVAAYPDTVPEQPTAGDVFLLIGSERGFCGDFNEILLHELQLIQEEKPGRDCPFVLATGRKLHGSLNGNPCVTAFLEGASVVEEVETVLTRVVDTLMALQKQHGVLSLSALYHVIDNNAVVRQHLLPPFQVHCQRRAEVSISPVLNLTPELFLIELSHHYLYASLHEIFYASLMAENHQRIRHLEGAVKHLDEKVETLQRQVNTRRQEEIIEEIEVLLLSTAGKTNSR